MKNLHCNVHQTMQKFTMSNLHEFHTNPSLIIIHEFHMKFALQIFTKSMHAEFTLNFNGIYIKFIQKMFMN